MSQNLLDQKNLAIKLYTEASIPVSSCYRFKNVKRVQTIYYYQNDYGSEVAAKVLSDQISKENKHEVHLIPVNYNLVDSTQAKQDIVNFMRAYPNADTNAIVICDTIAAWKIIELKESATQNIPQLFLPDYICELNQFWRDELDETAYYIDVAPPKLREKIDSRLPYERKLLKQAEYLIVFISSLETWESAILAYQEIAREYGIQPRIVIVNDLKEEAPRWFCRSQLKRALRIFRKFISKDIGIYTCDAKYLDEFLHESLNRKAIMFLPQLKTHWVHELSKSHCDRLDYYIIENNIADLMDYNGPIGTQRIYDEILRLADYAKDEMIGENFKKLYVKKEFCKFNKSCYWINLWLGSHVGGTSLLISSSFK